MIIRILGEGQYDVSDEALDRLNEHDTALESAVEADDVDAFTAALSTLLDGVRAVGTPHEADSLDESDLILPPSDATIDEVRALLSDDGLIPRVNTRFIKDTGLTVRMTTVMFLLGGLFVALVVGLMFAAGSSGYGGAVPIIGAVGIGIAVWQWWNSDKTAMRAMRAYEVTPEEQPELHGMIDRLCALAEMPKPRVGISEMDIPNAFATGRSPDRAVVCVTTGIMGRLSSEELEAVLAHELSHVAHRDVLVMTVASSAGIVAGMLLQGARFGGLMGRRDRNTAAFFVMALIASLVVYAVSFFLLRLLSRYRELCADRSGAYLTLKPAALGSALQKITGEIAAIPQRDLRAPKSLNALCIAPAISGASLKTLTSTHPSLEQRLEQLARIQTELDRRQP